MSEEKPNDPLLYEARMAIARAEEVKRFDAAMLLAEVLDELALRHAEEHGRTIAEARSVVTRGLRRALVDLCLKE